MPLESSMLQVKRVVQIQRIPPGATVNDNSLMHRLRRGISGSGGTWSSTARVASATSRREMAALRGKSAGAIFAASTATFRDSGEFVEGQINPLRGTYRVGISLERQVGPGGSEMIVLALYADHDFPSKGFDRLHASFDELASEPFPPPRRKHSQVVYVHRAAEARENAELLQARSMGGSANPELAELAHNGSRVFFMLAEELERLGKP